MSYKRQVPPPEYEHDWIEKELAQIERAFNEIELVETHVAPAKPRTGMVRLADGTNWNPGAGAGAYVYYGGAWNKMG